MPSRPSQSIIDKNYLDFQSIKELPNSYAWPSLEDPCLDEAGLPKPDPTIPVINLEDPKAQHLIGLASKSWGVFQVVNHGIQKILLEDIEIATKDLFTLPIHQKLKVARSTWPNSVTGYGPARISSFFPKRMWSEGFTIFGSPLQHARQLWPNHYTHFCHIIEEYQKQMEELAEKLMKLILGSLGISSQDIMKWANLLKAASGAIQLNSYPICPDPNRAMGLAAHTDSTLLTILHQSNTAGLQVFKERTGWVTVPPLSGGLVIHIGDLLHILSNGQYPSVYHRATVNRVQHRFSMAYLYGPGSGIQIQPLQKLIDDTHPPLYRPVTWSEYLSIKGEHFNKALSLVQLNNNNSNNDDDNNNNNNDDDNNNNSSTNGPITVVEPKSIKVEYDNTPLIAFG